MLPAICCISQSYFRMAFSSRLKLEDINYILMGYIYFCLTIKAPSKRIFASKRRTHKQEWKKAREDLLTRHGAYQEERMGRMLGSACGHGYNPALVGCKRLLPFFF